MIHRAEYDKDYTRVKNGFVQDMSLSLKAKGLMLVILSLPDDWDFSIKGLSYMTNLSEQVVIKLVKELKSAGYITQKKVKNKQGQFVSYVEQLLITEGNIFFSGGISPVISHNAAHVSKS